jgi:hypothetical protein
MEIDGWHVGARVLGRKGNPVNVTIDCWWE